LRRLVLAAFALLPFAACGGVPSGPPLVSTQFPPGTGVVNVNSPFQSLNSLPPGAANFARGPGSTAPDYGSIVFSVF